MEKYKPFLSNKEIESHSVESELDYAQEEFVTVNEQECDS
jgi:hypothetical protein